jgi:phosphonate transport system ATP-binding protein
LTKLILQRESFGYKNTKVLEDISLSIQKGEKVALLGKSGSGKSTLLKKLYELNSENISYIPQELGLVENLSVFHNIYISSLDKNSTIYNIRNLLKPAQKEIDIILPILKNLHMGELVFKKSGELSGGQKQRTAIARAMLQNRKILLADEPISALDEFITNKALAVIFERFETIVCALHNVDIALEYFDRVIGIKDGKIVLDAKCKKISQSDTKELYSVCDEYL